MDRFLPYSRQLIDDDDIRAVNEMLASDMITQGPLVEEFEQALADYVGAKYAVSCATGTAALHLSCLALGLNKGSILVTSPITFLASANCAQYVGADTLFSDINKDSWCLSIPMLEELVKNKHVDAVVPVHFAGHSAEMATLKQLQDKYEFKIIEDACHALGGKYHGEHVGSCAYSDLSTFSFHPVKHVTTGEGGAVTTNDKLLYERLRQFRTHGMHKDADKFRNNKLAFDHLGNRNSWYYEMQELGFNYRITDIQCALGISQLTKVDRFVERRRHIAEKYKLGLGAVPLISTPIELPGVKHAYHLYPLLINFQELRKTRSQVMKELRELNIGTQVLYIPVHVQPYYADKYGYKQGDFPIAEEYYEQCLSIPIFPGMTDNEVDFVISGVLSTVT